MGAVDPKKPPAVNMGSGIVYKFPSASQPGLYHYTVRFANENGVQCSCQGWNRTGHCWHLDKIPSVGPAD
jgi:hypothetical protein